MNIKLFFKMLLVYKISICKKRNWLRIITVEASVHCCTVGKILVTVEAKKFREGAGQQPVISPAQHYSCRSLPVL